MRIVAIYRGSTELTAITNEDSGENLLSLHVGGDTTKFGDVDATGRYNPANNKWRTRTDLGQLVHFEDLQESLQELIAVNLFGGHEM